jgi:hypothetical protein
LFVWLTLEPDSTAAAAAAAALWWRGFRFLSFFFVNDAAWAAAAAAIIMLAWETSISKAGVIWNAPMLFSGLAARDQT